MTVWTQEMKRAAMADAAMVCKQSLLIAELELEISRLRAVVIKYGDRARMSNATEPALQQTIDRAFEGVST